MVYLSLLAETPSAAEPSIFPRDDDKDDAELYPEERQNVSYFSNYYFLLIILAVLILVAAWLIHSRNVRRRALSRQNGQQASARDVEAWPGTRRLLHGGCYTDVTGPPTLFSFAQLRDWMSMEKRRHRISQSRRYLLRLSRYRFGFYQQTGASDHCRRSIKRCHEGCRELGF